jgi:hypothetical protein
MILNKDCNYLSCTTGIKTVKSDENNNKIVEIFFSTPTFNPLPLRILKYSNFTLVLLYYFLFYNFSGKRCTPLQTYYSDKLLYFSGLLNLPENFSKGIPICINF